VEQVKQAQCRTKNRTQSLLPISLQMFRVPSPVRAVVFLLQFYFFKPHVIARVRSSYDPISQSSTD
jgi:hypothetical protein